MRLHHVAVVVLLTVAGTSLAASAPPPESPQSGAIGGHGWLVVSLDVEPDLSLAIELAFLRSHPGSVGVGFALRDTAGELVLSSGRVEEAGSEPSSWVTGSMATIRADLTSTAEETTAGFIIHIECGDCTDVSELLLYAAGDMRDLTWTVASAENATILGTLSGDEAFLRDQSDFQGELSASLQGQARATWGRTTLTVPRPLIGFFGQGGILSESDVQTPAGRRSCPCVFDLSEGAGDHHFSVREVGFHQPIVIVAAPAFP